MRLRQVDAERFTLLDEEDAQRSEIRAGIEMGKRLGIISERAMIQFLETRCLFAAGKNLQPADVEWASNLFSCGGCDPERTIEYIHEVMSKKAQQVTAPIDDKRVGHA